MLGSRATRAILSHHSNNHSQDSTKSLQRFSLLSLSPLLSLFFPIVDLPSRPNFPVHQERNAKFHTAMRRIFGAPAPAKATVPPPTLDDATKRLNMRQAEIENKIRKCDAELRNFGQQLKNTRSPAGQRIIKNKARRTLEHRKMLVVGNSGLTTTVVSVCAVGEGCSSCACVRFAFASNCVGATSLDMSLLT
jgi:hypothetical protein